MERMERMAGLRAGGKGKVVTAAEALALVQDGDTVASSGFVGIGFAENLAVALEQRFMAEGSAARPDAGLRGRAGRRQGARPEPPGP
jgi:propionate CoA-transferase